MCEYVHLNPVRAKLLRPEEPLRAYRWSSYPAGRWGKRGFSVQESAVEKAERLAREEVQKLGWREADLATRPKGDRAKAKLAMKLRAETTMKLKWIAARLRMGTGASLSNLLSAQRRGRR